MAALQQDGKDPRFARCLGHLVPMPSVSSSSSAATSWILSPSQGVTTLPLSNSNSGPPLMPQSAAGASISMELTRLYVGEAGAVVAAATWKLIQRPESTVETSDSSHSGMLSGCSRRRARVGLAGAETTKNGLSTTAAASQVSGLRTLAGGGRDVGDETGGVTGALLETRSGGRPRRNGSICRHAATGLAVALLPTLSSRVGLGKLDDAGLAWYDGTGLAKVDDGALSSCDDEQGLAPGGGLHPCHDTGGGENAL
jgi:hypothetical protein